MKVCAKIFVSVILFLCFVFISSPVSAGEIQQFDEDISLQADGRAKVTEKILYDFGGEERHGIYRNINTTKVNQNQQKFYLTINNISVTDQNGIPLTYTSNQTDDTLGLRIGDADKVVSGEKTYVISYLVSGGVTYFSDHDEFYWNVTGNGWEEEISESTVTLSLPQNITDPQIRYDCFTGASGSTEKACTSGYTDGKYTFTLNRGLSSREGFTVLVGFPKNIVAVLEPNENPTSGSTANFPPAIALILILLSFVWYVLLPFVPILVWYWKGRDPKAPIGAAHVWFSPPKSQKTKEEYTPGICGTIIDETVDIRDITATIVDLARRGYFKIVEKKKNDFYLEKMPEPKSSSSRPELLEYEQKLLSILFTSGESVRVKDLKIGTKLETVKNQMYEFTLAEGIFPRNPQTVRTIAYTLAAVALATFNIFLTIVTFIMAKFMPRKTIYGAQTANMIQGLKTFLVSQDKKLEFMAEKQLMFEKLLPYAVAFGVEKIWALRFKDIGIVQPEWFESYETNRVFNSIIFANALSSSLNSFSRAAYPPATTTTSSRGFSSGFGGGGFSGGGGGGGGGGSW